MGSKTVPYPIEKLVPLDSDASTEASVYAAGADAENTKRGYSADWNHFVRWCEKRNAASLPARPDDVALYLRSCIEKDLLSVATVRRRIAAIARAHKINGLLSPNTEWVVKSTIRRLVREYGKPPQKVKALLLDDIRAIVRALPPTLTGARDRAILLLGFAGALRRSDVVGLEVDDISAAKEGIITLIRQGKTDHERKGEKVAIPRVDNDPEMCPVHAVNEWLTVSDIEEGPLFRKIDRHGNIGTEALSGFAIACIIKKYAPHAGKRRKSVSGHSLRSGFITTAAMKGVPERDIQKQSRHRSVEVLRGYIQDATLFSENAARKVFEK